MLLTRRSAAGTELAYAKFNGRIVSFGLADDPESRVRFAQLKAQWEANGRRLPEEEPDSSSAATVEDLADAYLERAETHFRRLDGTPTGRIAHVEQALAPLLAMYRDLPVAEFDAVKLDTVRTWMVEAKKEPRKRKKPLPPPPPDAPPPPARFARKTINELVTTIKAAFRWGASPEGKRMVPPAVVADLDTLPSLQAGRTTARESQPRQPVAEAVMRATLPLLPRRIAAIVEVLWFSAARCGEIVQLRTRDVDMSGDVWIFRPPQHKNAHRGKPREIDLGKQAQRVLRPFVKLDRDAYWFDPREQVAENMAARSEARVTPPWPSHMERNRTKRVANPARPPSDRYVTLAIGVAIRRACKKAGIKPSWSVHQLRHAALTRIRTEFGLEAAQAIGGHACLPMAETYTHTAARQLAQKVAQQVG